MTHAKKRANIKLLTLIVMCVMLLSGLLIAAPTMTAKAESDSILFHGIDITGLGSIEAYSLNLDVPKDFYIRGGKTSKIYSDWWKRKDTDVLLTFYFPNVKIKNKDGIEQSVQFNINMKVDMPSALSYGLDAFAKATIKNASLSISLSNNFYLEFKKIDESKFLKYYAMLHWGGKGYQVYSGRSFFTTPPNLFESSKAELKVTGVPPTIVDEDSDNYDPNFGNNGDNTAPDTSLPNDETSPPPTKEKYNFFESIADMFSTTVEVIYTVLILFGIVVIVLPIVFRRR